MSGLIYSSTLQILRNEVDGNWVFSQDIAKMLTLYNQSAIYMGRKSRRCKIHAILTINMERQRTAPSPIVSANFHSTFFWFSFGWIRIRENADDWDNIKQGSIKVLRQRCEV